MRRKQHQLIFHHLEAPASPLELLLAIFPETETAPVAALKAVTARYPRIPHLFRAPVPQLRAVEETAVAVEVLSGQ